MDAVLNALGMALDLAIVILAFSLIIIIHELGHFLAARWAGIRVLAFAVGFGPALVSYRKGLGWRRGSSVAEYNAFARFNDTTIDRGWLHVHDRINHPISPTEYRINALPFGGYVKMLGQDDADPAATSNEVDGYQQCIPWKRMVVISAGVVFNLVSAAALFVVVFMAGLKTEPPVIGAVDPGSPSAIAVALEAEQLGITTPGLMSGDRVLSIDGQEAQSFKDLMIASAMAHRGDAIVLLVRRDGVSQPLTFPVVPKESPVSRLLQFGVGPAMSTKVFPGTSAREAADIKAALERAGLVGVEPGMRLARVNGAAVGPKSGGGSGAIADAARTSGGKPVTLDFVGDPDDGPVGPPVSVTIQPVPKLEQVALQVTPESAAMLRHVGGLTTAMQVDSLIEAGKAAGLRAGDVFVQIGSVEWPSQPAGIAEIRRHTGSSVHVAVARRGAGEGSPWTIVDLKQVPVNGKGQIGFNLADPERAPLFLGAVGDLPRAKATPGAPDEPARPDVLTRLKIAPGSLLTSVAGTPVRTLGDVRVALAKAAAAVEPGPSSVTIELTLNTPLTDASGAITGSSQTVAWTADRSPGSPDRGALEPVLWQAEGSTFLFDAEQFELKADGPVQAMKMGFRETRQVVLSTYVTLLRLFQGSVKIEHLKGPVGIAHMGTMLVDRGLVWMLFFIAIVSVNLAVINFLPVPITDGGHFLFLLYEQVTGRPASNAIQMATMYIGITLVIGMFLVVTFNDISNLVVGR